MKGSKKLEEFKRGFKWRFLGKEEYGKLWYQDNSKWYDEIHNSNYLLHDNFKDYFKSNHRLSMMYHSVIKMEKSKLDSHIKNARNFIQQYTS